MFGIATEILWVYFLIGLAVFLFINNRVSFDIASLIIMALLVVTGILTPAEGLSGFSNQATVTIACMFILSEGLTQTGALTRVGDFFLQLNRYPFRIALFIIMLIIAVISAFINNTAAVAIFIPVIIGLAKKLGKSASKLLMPLSFAAMFGGVCTLIGTSTNLLVDSIATDNGLEPFTMFEFAPMGLIFLVAGFAYLFTIGINQIPKRREEENLTDNFAMSEYLTDVVLDASSDFVDTPLYGSALLEDLDLEIVEVYREDGKAKTDRNTITLRANDVPRIRGSIDEINKLLFREDVHIIPNAPWRDSDFEVGNAKLIEVVVSPESSYVGKKLKHIQLYEEFEAILLAIRQGGSLQQEDLDEVRLQGGTSLLLFAKKERVASIKAAGEFILATEKDVAPTRKERIPVAVAILLWVVGLAAFNVLPIVVSATCGVILMILTGCLTNEQAWRSVNWKVIFLLAGMLPLGVAMEKTGAATLLADTGISYLETYGPRAVLSAFFFLSMMLTNIISNQATAALLAPIAIEVSRSIGVHPEPMLIAVTMAASLSFMSPIGYQTNTMIFGPGQYTFGDFLRIGTP